MGFQAKNNTDECIDDYLESRDIEYSSSSSDVILKKKKTTSKKRTMLSVTMLKFVTMSEETNFGKKYVILSLLTEKLMTAAEKTMQ